MLTKVKRLFFETPYADEEDQHKARILIILLSTSLVMIPAVSVANILIGEASPLIILLQGVFWLILLTLQIWVVRHRLDIASIGLITLTSLFIMTVIIARGTLRIPTTSGYFIIVIAAVLLFDIKGVVWTVLLNVLAILGLAWMESKGMLPGPVEFGILTYASIFVVLLILAAVLTHETKQIILRESKRRQAEASVRGQVEQTLEETRQFSVAIMNAIPDMLLELDQQGVVLNYFSTPEIEPLLPSEQFLGKNLAEVMPVEIADLALPAITQALESGKTQLVEYDLPPGSGDRYFEARLVASGDRRVLGIVREITQTKRAQLAIQVSEARYRSIVEDMPALVCRFKADGTLTFVNQNYCAYFGTPREALLGFNFLDFIPAEDRDAVRQHFQSLTLENPAVSYEHQVTGPDGALRWQRWTDRALFDSSGRVLEYQSVGEDITTYRQAQAEMQSSQEQMRQALRAANAGAWEWDIQSNITRWTEENFLVMGLEPGSVEPSYQTWLSCIHPDDRKQASGQITKAVEYRANLDMDFRVLWPDGSVHWVKDIGKMRFDSAGEPTALYGIQIDITAQKQIEQEIRTLNEELERRVQERTAELEEANRDLESFAYSVSHDLRAPLRGIYGYSRLLAMDTESRLSGEAVELIANIHKYTDAMSTLIDGLLHFSRLGRRPVSKQLVSMDAMAREVTARLLEQEKERQVQVSYGDLPPALADPALLEQVWANLVGNALKYTRPCPLAEIEIGSQVQEGQTAYYVRDNGVGFDMKFADKLFGVFQRLHRAEDFEGTGIGLANVKRIIERHNGRVWAQAAPDQGATFYFTLPQPEPPQG